MARICPNCGRDKALHAKLGKTGPRLCRTVKRGGRIVADDRAYRKAGRDRERERKRARRKSK